MLSRTHRFIGPNSLRFVYGRGKTIRGPLFSVKYALNQQRSSYRVAVVVSRKVCKSAVGRNRMRRRVYAAIQGLGTQINGSYDIVITIFQPELLDIPSAELNQQLQRQLLTAGVLSKRVKV
ncbi:ribonuclease P protein component [Candidatus Saccharibacteria bacterium RIFCSPHIGHO2_01_FULL_48_12]|nr:MAG: ribonuclease P protein component [Candidatus Saccharibacteria bacterium RIFCSPHIGHO2_01_FULL_48_12]OGL36524.1 MAG: ribonuclease P protein component [Candidatus Saccharibacteria bacterium RIFCSPHIGHO2_12_FULL_48_21]